ncbi:MAG: hypothetical protein ACRC4N_03695, partial [Gammaproteobacteria bacterium]
MKESTAADKRKRPTILHQSLFFGCFFVLFFRVFVLLLHSLDDVCFESITWSAPGGNFAFPFMFYNRKISMFPSKLQTSLSDSSNSSRRGKNCRFQNRT